MWVVFTCVIFSALAIFSVPVSCDIQTDDNDTFETSLVDKSICPETLAKYWSYDFHDCFIGRKYGDGGQDLNNIVDRILEHSRICVENSTKNCRPSYEGFIIIMDKVISQMQDYCSMYLENIKYGREEIKDLECVDNSLSVETYKKCFSTTLKEQANSSKTFQKDVEDALSCMNRYNNLCSDTAKKILNRIVRTVLGVDHPEKEPFEEIVEPAPEPEPPMKWYDYIAQPFVSMWNAIKSFFGF